MWILCDVKVRKVLIFFNPLTVAAASSPELFINSVGTFITKSDLGKYIAIFVGYISSKFEFSLLHHVNGIAWIFNGGH